MDSFVKLRQGGGASTPDVVRKHTPTIASARVGDLLVDDGGVFEVLDASVVENLQESPNGSAAYRTIGYVIQPEILSVEVIDDSIVV